jgi:hypothetical protein
MQTVALKVAAGATGEPGRLLGFVRVEIAGHLFDLPVHAMWFATDGTRAAGGFFSSEGRLGILVDEAVTPSEAKSQIEQGAAEAVRHISRQVLS